MKLLGRLDILKVSLLSSLLCFHFCCWLCVFFPLIIVTVTLKLRRSCKLNIGAPCHHHRVVPIGKNDKDWVSCRRCLLSLNLLFSGICSVARRQKSRNPAGSVLLQGKAEIQKSRIQRHLFCCKVAEIQRHLLQGKAEIQPKVEKLQPG